MTIDVLNIKRYKTALFFVNYSILPSSCSLCTNVLFYLTSSCVFWPMFDDGWHANKPKRVVQIWL